MKKNDRVKMSEDALENYGEEFKDVIESLKNDFSMIYYIFKNFYNEDSYKLYLNYEILSYDTSTGYYKRIGVILPSKKEAEEYLSIHYKYCMRMKIL